MAEKEYQNIIIRMPNWLGDVVMATPLIADLRARWPNATITAMCLSSCSPLLIGNPHLNEIFSFTKPNAFLRRQDRNIVARIKQGKYDLGVLLTNSFSSAMLFWRGNIEERVGFASDCRSLFLTKAPPVPKTKQREHLVITYKKLLEPLGFSSSKTNPELFITQEERGAVKALLGEYSIPENNRIVGINPLAAYGPAKCWPAERFREVAKRLAEEKDVTVLFFGDNQGAPLVKEICADLPKNVINLAGLTKLRELMALIESCDLFITNDSGPMHIAAALKTPLVAIFGSTNEIATGPYEHGQVIHKHVECSPCYLRTCPIDFRCMKRITVEEVLSAAKKNLNRSLPVRRVSLSS